MLLEVIRVLYVRARKHNQVTRIVFQHILQIHAYEQVERVQLAFFEPIRIGGNAVDMMPKLSDAARRRFIGKAEGDLYAASVSNVLGAKQTLYDASNLREQDQFSARGIRREYKVQHLCIVEETSKQGGVFQIWAPRLRIHCSYGIRRESLS